MANKTFKKSNNLLKLEEAVKEKNSSTIVKKDNAERVDKQVSKVIPVDRKSITEKSSDNKEEEIVLNVDSQIMMEMLQLKNESLDVKKKKIEMVTVRMSADSLSKMKELTATGVISQADIIASLLEKEYKRLKGDK